MNWFSSISFRWKLQISFFLITLVTILFLRWGGYVKLQEAITLAKANVSDPAVINELESLLSNYITSSIWQSLLEFAVIFGIISLIATALVKPIEKLVKALASVESGDMTQFLDVSSKDEFGALESSYNNMLENLGGIIGDIDEYGKQMGSSAFQIASISKEISETSKDETKSAADVSDANKQLQNIAQTVKDTASQANERAMKTDQLAKSGMETIQENIVEMDNTVSEVNRASQEVELLSESAQKIHNIIGTIRDIAEQTNLLALNAAIEAARAGEQGRGFAVVADEVRNLAARTTSSTSEISQIIDTLTNHVSTVSSAMEQVVERVHNSQERAKSAAGAMDEITTDITSNLDASHQISELTTQQMSEFNQLQSGLDNLSTTIRENSTKVNTTQTIGDDLYKETDRINSLLKRFTFLKRTTIEAEQNEQRNAPRMDSSLRVTITNNGETIDGISSDLSMTGVQLRTSVQLLKDDYIEVGVFVPFESLDTYRFQQPLTINGTIVWTKVEDDNHVCGVKFDSINKKQKEHLKMCFDYFEKEAEFKPAQTTEDEDDQPSVVNE